MRLRITMTAAFILAATGTNAEVHVCTPCEAGTYAPAGSTVCTPCEAGTYAQVGAASCAQCSAGTYSGYMANSCQSCLAGTYSGARAGNCTPCETGKYCPGGTNVQNCPSDSYCINGEKYSKNLIPNFPLSSFIKIAEDSTPGRNECATGTNMKPGIYRVVVGGGNSHSCKGTAGTGGKLTYNFYLPSIVSEYSLCAGSNGSYDTGSSGGAGSYMKFVMDGNDYYFAAGGAGGGCIGGGGGGIGDGGMSVFIFNSGQVGPTSGGLNSPTYVPCNLTGDAALACVFSSSAGYGGGGNGCGSYYSYKGVDVALNIINYYGISNTFNGRLGGYGGCSGKPGASGNTTHQTNVIDPDTCTQCAKLYKLK